MPEDVKLFAVLTGDINRRPSPTRRYSESGMFREVMAHGMWSGSLISTVLGTQFPGPGTILIDQSLHFARPVTIGDTITITVTAKQKFDHNKHVILRLRVHQSGRSAGRARHCRGAGADRKDFAHGGK